MTVTGSCHCGAVRIEAPSAPEWVASCNCSICTKLGPLVAYYPDDAPENGGVRVTGDTAAYIWGDRMIALHHCLVCACFTDWRSTGESYGRVGVNARPLDGFAVTKDGPTFEGAPLEVRFLDNAG